jgi:hypothetical protein
MTAASLIVFTETADPRRVLTSRLIAKFRLSSVPATDCLAMRQIRRFERFVISNGVRNLRSLAFARDDKAVLDVAQTL